MSEIYNRIVESIWALWKNKQDNDDDDNNNNPPSDKKKKEKVKELLPNIVSRLGFNPTSKGRKSKIELKKTA